MKITAYYINMDVKILNSFWQNLISHHDKDIHQNKGRMIRLILISDIHVLLAVKE